MAFTSFSIKNNIASITFTRPDKYNAVNEGLGHEFIQHLRRCQEDDVRVVFITGEGKAFCVGQDLQDVIDQEDRNAYIAECIDSKFNPIVEMIYDLEKPVIAAVNGPAVGAGANIALICDVVVASEKAYFSQGFGNIGLIPDSAGTYVLPRLIGFQKALASALLGDRIYAEEAERIGMIYKMLDASNFEEQAFALAEKLSELPTKALALTKMAYNQGLANTFHDQLKVEKKLQMEAGSTDDFKEGVDAFIEKRKPQFKGK